MIWTIISVTMGKSLLESQLEVEIKADLQLFRKTKIIRTISKILSKAQDDKLKSTIESVQLRNKDSDLVFLISKMKNNWFTKSLCTPPQSLMTESK